MRDVDGRLHIGAREHRGATLVRPIGVLDVSTCTDFRDSLLRYSAEQPAAIIVDVGGLQVPSAYALSVFATVWMQVSEWPGVPLMLVAEEPARRAEFASHPVCRLVPVHSDLEAALQTLDRPPQRRRDRLALPGAARSSAVARQFVRRRCGQWGVPQVAEDAAAVVTELVENVVQHTASHAGLRLELCGGTLRVAVSDTDPSPAVLRESVGSGMPSTGLAIVAKIARSWGCTPTANGKVVWAVLRAG